VFHVKQVADLRRIQPHVPRGTSRAVFRLAPESHSFESLWVFHVERRDKEISSPDSFRRNPEQSRRPAERSAWNESSGVRGPV